MRRKNRFGTSRYAVYSKRLVAGGFTFFLSSFCTYATINQQTTAYKVQWKLIKLSETKPTNIEKEMRWRSHTHTRARRDAKHNALNSNNNNNWPILVKCLFYTLIIIDIL